MISSTMLQTGRAAAGAAYLIGGMSSSGDPLFIGDQSYRTGQNILNRGGVCRTRPGYTLLFDLPAGNLQGLSYFKPLTAEGYYVFAVNGLVYASQFPFTSYSQIPNIQFYPYARELFFCQCVQSAVLNTDGSVSVTDPKRVLVMQDGGYTQAAYWDGATSGHLDPSVPATFQSVIDTSGAVTSVSVTYGGTGYNTVPTITFQAPSAVAGVEYRTATGHVVIGAGQIQSVVIDDPGAGYTFAPSISISCQKLGPPLGGPMCWSGDRLWVAQDNKVYASDISNPLGFSETLYASGGGFFLFTENVTAIYEIPSFQDPNLAIFTRNTSTSLQSSIRDRSTWQSTPGFQTIIFPGIGCVGDRTVIAKFGELWWLSDAGFTNFNAASQSKISSYLVPQDSAMAVSKFNLSSDLSLACAGVYENFLLLSVPYSDIYNQHTWVYDQSVTSGVAQSVITGPYQGATAGWAGYWTGTRPVQWASGPFNGVTRIAHVSVDYDGVNRLWAAFDPSRTDSDNPITCFVETKTHADFGPTGGQLDLKKFVYADLNLSDIIGDVQLSVYWAGVRGNYKLLQTYNLAATDGSIELNVPIGNVSTNRSQTRRLKTPDVLQDGLSTADSVDVENNPSNIGEWIDIGFSLLITWTGQAALRGYRIFADPYEEPAHGNLAVYENDPRVLTGDFSL